MASDYIAPLNLQYIFQNVLAGSPLIFMGLFIIGCSIIAGLFKMKGRDYALSLALASILLYDWFGGGLLLLILFVGGLIIFNIVSKIVKD